MEAREDVRPDSSVDAARKLPTGAGADTATDAAPDAAAPAIRPATSADVERVLAFWPAAAEGTSISDDPQGVARLIARDPGALLLAEEDGALVGTVIAGYDGWRCHLYRLAVHPERRRRGIAGALLRAAEARFVALGGRRGDAMVLVDNEAAHPAWRAAGYGAEEQWRRWTKPLVS